MPLWDRHCDKCDEIFAVICSFETKNDEKECPYCGATEGVYMLSAPTLSRHSERLMTHRQDAGFNEVLDKIKERNPRTNLATGRSSGETSMD